MSEVLFTVKHATCSIYTIATGYKSTEIMLTVPGCNQ